MKKCYTCQTFKNEVDFNKNKSKADGLNNICKHCSRERSKKYYSENHEKHVNQVGVRREKTAQNRF